MSFFKKAKKKIKKDIAKVGGAFSGKNNLDPFAALATVVSPGAKIADKALKDIGVKGGATAPADYANKILSPVNQTLHELDPVTRTLRNKIPAFRRITDYTGMKPATAAGTIITGAGFAGGLGGGSSAVPTGPTTAELTAAGPGAGAAGADATLSPVTLAPNAVKVGATAPTAGGGVLNGLSGLSRFIGPGLGLLGSGLDYLGARDAARAEADASRMGIEELRRQFDLTREDLKPWLDDGRQALADMANPDAFRTSPGYDFRRREGMNTVQGSAAAAGGLYSGNTLKALTEYGDNLAEDEYTNWWNRLASRAGLGQTTATSLGSMGGANANSVAELLRDIGSSRASGIRGKYGAIGTGLGSVAGGLDNYFSSGPKINPRSLYDYSTVSPNGGVRYA